LGGRLITKSVSLCNEALNGVRSSKGQQLVLVVLVSSLLCRVAHERHRPKIPWKRLTLPTMRGFTVHTPIIEFTLR
jgi:hypothetical protein